MELSELSSSQSGAQHKSILVNAQGSPLKINLQAVELEGRPKLVRVLKSSGALVASNAKEAGIILVDSTTESGKRLIRTWGRDASKVVLEYSWARASVAVGRPLLQADNWGGAMTVDDGKPVTIDGIVVDEDELEEIEALVTNPLPTPRVTPVEPTSQRAANSAIQRSDFARSESNTTSRITGPPLVPATSIAQSTTTLEEPVAANIHDDIPPAHTPPPPQAPQPLSYVQSSLFAPPSQSPCPYAYTQFASPQPYPPSQAQMIPTQPFPHTGLAPSQVPQPQMIHAPSVSHTPLPSAPSPMMQTTPNTTNMNGVNLQVQNLATIMTMMDVVRHMDQSRIGQSQFPISQPPTNTDPSTSSERPSIPGSPSLMSTLQATQSFDTPQIDGSRDLGNTSTTSRKRASSADSEDRPLRRKTRANPFHHSIDQVLTPSISRKRTRAVKPATPPPKQFRKGKQRAILTEPSDHSDVYEITDASDDDDSRSRHSSVSIPSRPRNVVARKKHGEIFLSGSGQPLRFFVQVDLHGRHAVVTNIKKHKGKIVNSIADADYSILFARSDTFHGLLNEATALGKSAILSAFVADCIEEGALLDEADYVVESVAKVKGLKRGRQNAFSVKVETTETLSLPQRAKVVKPISSPATNLVKKSKAPLPDKKPKKAQTSAPSNSTVENREESRSPTPPAPRTRQMMNSGRYLFTEIEDEYFLQLAKHHLTCDPIISNTSLINKVHKKLPHHSVGSWGVHIEKKLKGQLDGIRKRANIAKRKRDTGPLKQTPSHWWMLEQAPSNGPICDSTEDDDILPSPSQPSQEDLEQEDFDVITHFFASGGGGDDDDDERVWQELGKHRPCRSASSWPDYYAAHQHRVYARIEELTKEHAGD